MNFIARKLEEFGQNPRTFPAEVALFAVRCVVAMFLALAPLAIIIAVFGKSLPSGPATPDPAPLKPEILFLFALFFLYMWFAVLAMLALIGSWFWLARRFRAPRDFKPQQLLRWQSGNVGVVGINNILNVGVGPEGLYLSLLWPFSFMQPPLLIPWSEIVAVRRTKILFQEQLWLTVGQPKLATIILSKSKSVQMLLPYVAPVLKTRHTEK